MRIKSLRSFLVLALLSAFVHLAHAIAYCPKPNGIATRELAFEKLQSVRKDLSDRFGPNQRYLIIASVPEGLQREQRFKLLEDDETVRQASVVPAIRQRASDWAKEQGSFSTEDQAAKDYVRAALSQKSNEPQEPIGLMYLYSNDMSVLRRFSSEIADPRGIVVEGEPNDVQALLTAKSSDEKMFGWWKKNIPNDVDLVVFVGFSPHSDVRNLIKRNAMVLRVASWDVLINHGFGSLNGLMDVKPEAASVLNLFPLAAGDVVGWGMSDVVGKAYVSSGQRLQKETASLGYEVHKPQSGATPEDVLSYIKAKTEAGKRVLIYAETTQSPDGEYLMRIPGQSAGITSKHLLSLSDETLQKTFIISCNSQALSPNLPLAIVGTIYTDTAAQLVRQTFAAPQADNMGDYLQASTLRTTSWLEPVARTATAVVPKATDTQSVTVIPDGTYKFRQVAYVAQVTRPPAAISEVISGAPTTLPSSSSASSPTPHQAPELYLAGVFGAACREGLRWKRLMEQRKAKAFLRLPYLALSLALMLAAGGVAYLFGQQVTSATFALVVAFVAGAGFEKLVKMAADLKIWSPKSVPMGPTSVSDLESELKVGETLSFLRHGD